MIVSMNVLNFVKIGRVLMILL